MTPIAISPEEFRSKYQLLKEISEGSPRSYHAVSASGAVVMVHLFDAEPAADAERLLTGLERVPEPDRQKILRVYDVAGAPAVVTRFILDFTSLRAWLDERIPPQDRAVAEHAADPSEPSSFTQLFGALQEPVATPPAESGPPSDEPRTFADSEPATAAPGDEATTEPGEFTRIFQAPIPTSDSKPPVPRERTASAPPDSAETPRPTAPAPEPGEFTRMFQSPTDPRSPEPPLHQEAGEFTRSFEARKPDSSGTFDPPPPVSSPPTAPAPPHTPAAPVGDPSPPPPPAFRLDHSPAPPADTTPPVAPSTGTAPDAPPRAGEFTQIFGRPGAPPPVDDPQNRPPVAYPPSAGLEHAPPRTPPGDTGDPAAVPYGQNPGKAAHPPPATPAAGASEFTRIISAAPSPPAKPATPAEVPAEPVTTAPTPPAENRSTLVLIIAGLCVVIVLLLGLIAFLALRAAEPPPPASDPEPAATAAWLHTVERSETI